MREARTQSTAAVRMKGGSGAKLSRFAELVVVAGEVDDGAFPDPGATRVSRPPRLLWWVPMTSSSASRHQLSRNERFGRWPKDRFEESLSQVPFAQKEIIPK